MGSLPRAHRRPSFRVSGHDDVARYGLSLSFLTQPLEREDIYAEPRHWPWHWLYAELPQIVLQYRDAVVEF